jgi:hypothetical protein
MPNMSADIKSLSTPAARKVCEKFHVYPEAVDNEAARTATLAIRQREESGRHNRFHRGSAKAGNFHP